MDKKGLVLMFWKILLPFVFCGGICMSCVNGSNKRYNYKYGEIKKEVTQYLKGDSLFEGGGVKEIRIDCNNEYRGGDSLFQEVRLIPLEANKQSLIGEVNKIVVRDSLVYLLDIHQTKSLFVFNIHNGEFVRKIGSYGKSNSEYIEPTDFTIAGDKVIILDNRLKKLLTFDLNGKFEAANSIQFSLLSLEKTDNDTIFTGIAGDNRHIDAIYKYKILTFNRKGHILWKHLKMDYSMNVTEHNNLKSHEGKYWYHAPFANDIIVLDSLKTMRKYKFEFSTKGLPDDFVRRCDENFVNFMEKYRDTYSYVQDICFYTSRYLVARYASVGRGGHLLVYDMVHDRIIFDGIPVFDSQKGTLEDFIAMRIGGNSPLYADTDDRVYGLIPTGSLRILESSAQLEGVLKEGLTSNNNPVLFDVKIR